jgi:hypothetical protein
MKLDAAPIWLFVYAVPSFPLLGSWVQYIERRGEAQRLVRPTLIAATISFLWLYSCCFTPSLVGPAYGTLRGSILLGNFIGALLIGAVCFWARPIQWLTAAACAMTTTFWLITIAADSFA